MVGRGGSPRRKLCFVLHWYAVDDTGCFKKPQGALQRLKGWGKDRLVAVRCLVELVGPLSRSHWDAAGEPVGAPHPASPGAGRRRLTGSDPEHDDAVPLGAWDRFIEMFDIRPALN